MQGKILILDGAATNRIMLKSRLTSAFYDVLQMARLSDLDGLLEKARPDLILTAVTLPDGTAAALRARLRSDERTARIPVIAIAPANDPGARLSALTSGVDDVLSQPLNDDLLLARIRNLIRARQGEDEIRPRESTTRALGFAEPAQGFARASEITLIAPDKISAHRRAAELRAAITDKVSAFAQADLHHALNRTPPPDAVVIDLSTGPETRGLQMLAELRARSNTRHAAIIVVCAENRPEVAADALDRGADDVLPIGFAPNELVLRLTAQLRRKRRSDQIRDAVRHGLRAAVTDPMTGLYNRRYALPCLDRIICDAEETGTPYAVMLADLDHFKSINDRFGHAVGDAVLVETARRLRALTGGNDMIARIGGEEFLIVLTGVQAETARRSAQAFCRQISDRPIDIGRGRPPISITVSIGLVTGPLDGLAGTEDPSGYMIALADEALYAAKHAGRNQVTQRTTAA